MALLWHSGDDDRDEWEPVLRRLIPGLDLRAAPDLGDAREIDAALVWKPPQGLLASLPNLKAVFSIAAGIDALLRDPTLPDVPLCRMVDATLTAGMAEFVLLQVLKYHRGLDVFAAEQRERVWHWRRNRRPDERTVGVMGLGEIGAACARTLKRHGFTVRGWSRSEKALEGVETYAGQGGMARFLAGLDVLVCLLPLTPETEGVLDARLFAALPEGARLVHVGRGRHLVVADLLAALESGRLAHASLDVFPEEPLPEKSPLWGHPEVDVTPHIASTTDPESAGRFVAENYRRLGAGEPLLGVVDKGRGY
ncbi:MAG: glyoxylate/hydroxypyruvate reductase A [Geminicoccaceae bacterium]|nr:glyoxylate/hydroxypyruvate reductase A [Geminicoccaceae bacterium]